jgi:plastocyanin domain-containing protein
MGNRGLALAGININPMSVFAQSSQNLIGGSSGSASKSNIAKAEIKDGVQIITMSANNNGYTPNAFYVQKGMPVKWIINGDQLNSCNNAIVVPSLNKQVKLKNGENIVEFTPGDKDLNFSCWMGMIRGVIKVTDKLDSVDTSKADSSIPPASAGPSCCADPVGEESTAPSIYGDDITKVPTETLVGKALAAGQYQNVKFKGIGYELQPLIVVTGSGLSTKITFDMNAFDNAEGQYIILDAVTGDEVTSFTAKKGSTDFEFKPKKAGGYAILKDNGILGIIEVVDDLKGTKLEDVRNKYLGQ